MTKNKRLPLHLRKIYRDTYIYAAPKFATLEELREELMVINSMQPEFLVFEQKKMYALHLLLTDTLESLKAHLFKLPINKKMTEDYSKARLLIHTADDYLDKVVLLASKSTEYKNQRESLRQAILALDAQRNAQVLIRQLSGIHKPTDDIQIIWKKHEEK